MAENTKIEWATHSWSPWIGCSTPQEAVEDYWRLLTTLDDKSCVVIELGSKQELYRWNGYMWHSLGGRLACTQ